MHLHNTWWWLALLLAAVMMTLSLSARAQNLRSDNAQSMRCYFPRGSMATHSISRSNSIGQAATGTKVRAGGSLGKCLT